MVTNEEWKETVRGVADLEAKRKAKAATSIHRFVVEVEAATRDAAREQLEGANRTVTEWYWGLEPCDRTVRSYSGPDSLKDEY